MFPARRTRSTSPTRTDDPGAAGPLPNGTYSVVWQTLSAADGHTAEGYIPFTIGTVNDVRSVVPPDLGDASGPPEWLQTLARWISYMGVAIVVGAWPVWLLVLRPAISPAWQAGPRLVRRVRAIAYAGVLVALVGSLLGLMSRSMRPTTARDLFRRHARCCRIPATGRSGLPRRPDPGGRRCLHGGRLVVAAAAANCLRLELLFLVALVPVPFALISHASAQTDGRTTAITADYLHLASVSLWVGGLVLLVGGLVPTLRALTPAGRRVVLQRALPRFGGRVGFLGGDPADWILRRLATGRRP